MLWKIHRTNFYHWSSHHIISPLQCTSPCNFSPSHSIFGYLHPTPASRLAHIIIPPDLRASYTSFTETRFPLQNSFTPAVVSSTADMANPLPLQRANTMCYVGDFNFLSDHFVSDSIPQRNSGLNSFYSSLSEP
jgi:hypothetical protein